MNWIIITNNSLCIMYNKGQLLWLRLLVLLIVCLFADDYLLIVCFYLLFNGVYLRADKLIFVVVDLGFVLFFISCYFYFDWSLYCKFLLFSLFRGFFFIPLPDGTIDFYYLFTSYSSSFFFLLCYLNIY